GARVDALVVVWDADLFEHPVRAAGARHRTAVKLDHGCLRARSLAPRVRDVPRFARNYAVPRRRQACPGWIQRMRIVRETRDLVSICRYIRRPSRPPNPPDVEER